MSLEQAVCIALLPTIARGVLLLRYDNDGRFVPFYCSFTHTYAAKLQPMAVPLLLTSGPVRCEAVLHGCTTSPVCLFYTIATVFHDSDMMYAMRRTKSEPTLLPSQGLRYGIGCLFIYSSK